MPCWARNPVAGTVSWMIPIGQALQEGGIQAAYDCYAEIKDSPDYFFDEYELVTLVYQLMSVKKFDLAIEVLEIEPAGLPPERRNLSLAGKALSQAG